MSNHNHDRINSNYHYIFKKESNDTFVVFHVVINVFAKISFFFYFSKGNNRK